MSTVVTRAVRSTADRFGIDPYGGFFRVNTAARLRKLGSPVFLWNRTQLVLHERHHPDWPWITKDAVLWLDSHIDGSKVGFEWGSGKGTVWLAKRSRHLTSVEHHFEWAAKVRQNLSDAKVANVDYRLVEESAYLSVINEFADGSLDFVVLDGLFREQALGLSLVKIRPGGFLAFDNVNWYLPSESRTVHSRSLCDGVSDPAMIDAARELTSWQCLWTSNGVNDTAIYTKPS
jgi:Methyltransferase domain